MFPGKEQLSGGSINNALDKERGGLKIKVLSAKIPSAILTRRRDNRLRKRLHNLKKYIPEGGWGFSRKTEYPNPKTALYFEASTGQGGSSPE